MVGGADNMLLEGGRARHRRVEPVGAVCPLAKPAGDPDRPDGAARQGAREVARLFSPPAQEGQPPRRWQVGRINSLLRQRDRGEGGIVRKHQLGDQRPVGRERIEKRQPGAERTEAREGESRSRDAQKHAARSVEHDQEGRWEAGGPRRRARRAAPSREWGASRTVRRDGRHPTPAPAPPPPAARPAQEWRPPAG